MQARNREDRARARSVPGARGVVARTRASVLAASRSAAWRYRFSALDYRPGYRFYPGGDVC